MSSNQGDQPSSELHRKIAEKRVLIGPACDHGSAAVVEITAQLGFDVAWLDLEHGMFSWRDAEMFCQLCRARGVLPILRIADASRVSLLHSLDAGGAIVVIPMVESAAQARQIVEYGKYPPLGKRGFAGSTSTTRYGTIDGKKAAPAANVETHLLVQIETMEGLRNTAEILAVEGISGAVVGPADLSFSFGKPLDFDNAEFLKCFADAVRQIRAAGKIAATAAGRANLIALAIESGVQLVVATTELFAIRTQWEQTLRDVTSQVRGAGTK
jgi:4-hydroxy-2-oxoheptanedioate aldolase